MRYIEKFGLNWSKGIPRISGKKWWTNDFSYEVNRVTYNNDNDLYLIHYKNVFMENSFPINKGFSSDDCCVSKRII